MAGRHGHGSLVHVARVKAESDRLPVSGYLLEGPLTGRDRRTQDSWIGGVIELVGAISMVIR